MQLPDPLRRALSHVRREEWILFGLWGLCILIVLSTATGMAVGAVTMRYLQNFAMAVFYLFAGTRLLWALEARWSPTKKAGVWLKRFMFGNPEGRASNLTIDLEMVRGVLLLFISLAIYSNVKTRIPFINPELGDATFLAIDNATFGPGFISWIEEWFRGSKSVRMFFTDVYLHDYRYMLFLVFLVYVRRDTFTLRWIIVAVAFTYLLGILITAALPSHGPCFMEPERFKFMRRELIGIIQHNLAGFYDFHVNAVAEGGKVNTQPYFGIAAFPSLHVGHMTVMLAIAWRVWRGYAYLMIGVTLLTFLATIGFGWHYAIDGVGGFALAWAVVYVVGKRMAAWDARRVPPAAKLEG